MASLLVLFIFSLILAPVFGSLPDEKTYLNSNLSNINPHVNATTQLTALNPFYQCDIYPRVCLAKGGVNPDCCKKKCVNVITDCLNCGTCGMKCKSGEACCKGRCVDVSTSRSNCGLCGKKCKSGEACCKGRCVDVSTSRSNCGLCGMKCRYNESCCKGKCKNTYYDNKNCGACYNKCKKGESCAYGMCNYA